MQLIQKLQDGQKCMKKFEPSSRSKATEDIISIGSFVEVLVLNHYVLVRKILGKLSKLQDEDAQNKTNIQEPQKLCERVTHWFTHSVLSALRRSGLRTESRQQQLLDRDISIHNPMLTLHDSLKTYNTASVTLMLAIMIQKGMSMPVRRSQHHMEAILHNKDD
ncbi:hypothetical protein Tco_0080569 [Tanacetum coccineum]